MKKHIISFAVLLLFTLEAFSGNNINEIINTVKDRITVSGYAQAGYEDISGDSGKSEFLLRRAILSVSGEITSKWSAVFQYNFVKDAEILNCYTQYDFFPEFSVRLGQYLTPFSMDNQLSPTEIELIRTQSTGTKYLTGVDASDRAIGAKAGRDIGLMFLGSLFNKKLDYTLSIQNGQGINTKDGNKQKDVVGKLDYHISSTWTVSASFIKGKGHAIANSMYNDVLEGENYKRNRWSLGTALNLNKFKARAEYLQGKDKNTKSRAVYGVVSYELLPKLDLIASVDYLNRNKDISDKQTLFIGGLQYWFYPKCRLAAQYTYQKEKLRDKTQILQAQIQVQF
ncbi:MAG: porin [Bacteroidales bacterium]|nr:porin [Bacteroidales bacterium]